MLKKLNLGCGSDYKEGYINVDYKEHKGKRKPDMIWDLNKFPYPFKDNSVDKVYFSHTIEHLEEHKKPMEEVHRILKKGGKLVLIYPWWNCTNNFSYGHVYVYNQFWVNYFCEGDSTKTNYSDIKFKKINEELVPTKNFKFFPKTIRNLLSHLICNVSKEIRWVLEK